VGDKIDVEVFLMPPLSNTAGRERVKLRMEAGATLQTVIDMLVDRFDDPGFRLHLYDTEGRVIPAWRVFIGGRKPVRLGGRDGLATQVSNGDEITFLLGLAGG
jgi:hypothetical protein